MRFSGSRYAIQSSNHSAFRWGDLCWNSTVSAKLNAIRYRSQHKVKAPQSSRGFLWGYSVAAACSFSLLSQSVATASASAIPWAAVATFWGGRGEKSQPSYPYVRYIHRALPPAKPALLDVAPMLRCKSLLSFSFFSLFPFLLRARRAVRQEDCVNSATSRLSG